LAKISTFTPLLSLAPAALQLLHGVTVLLQGANRFTTGQWTPLHSDAICQSKLAAAAARMLDTGHSTKEAT